MNILGIDLGSTQTCAVISTKEADGLKIIGFGKTKTQGVKKGAITNIELAARSIQQAVDNAQMMSGVNYDKVVVSISGAYTESVDSVGVVSIPNEEISHKEIHRAMLTAKTQANKPSGYEIVHILPYSFKVNDQEVENPLNMTANRLEVSIQMIMSQAAHIENLKKAVEFADIRVDNLVLSGYASAIACLDESEKELGAVVVDMGGAVCDIVAHMGNSLRYNKCLPIGSYNITQDLSIALHTPIKEAEKIKLSYANLSMQPSVLVRVPSMGDERKFTDYPLESISNVIYARTEETMIILAKILSENPYTKNTGAGVILTGGMTKLAGFDEQATAMFDNKAVRLASTRKDLVLGFNEIYSDPENTCAIGLCLYEAGHFTLYEIDANQKFRYTDDLESYNEPVKQETTYIDEEKMEFDDEDLQGNDTIAIKEQLGLKPRAEKKRSNLISRLWNKYVINQF